MTITPEEIARLRALEAKATPGPWDKDGLPLVSIEGYVKDALAAFIRRADAVLVAEMRNAMPALLDELDRLHAVLRETHKTHCGDEPRWQGPRHSPWCLLGDIEP